MVEEDGQSPAPRTDEWDTCNKGPDGNDDGNGEVEGTTQGDDKDDRDEGTPQDNEDSNERSQDALGGTIGQPLLDEHGLYRMSPLEGSMHDVQVCMHSGGCAFS